MGFKKMFASDGHDNLDQAAPLTEAEERVLTKLATKVIEWKMTVPAILFIESVKPLNFIGSQALIFFEPFVQTLFNIKDYDTFREMMERRENVERLLLKIEELDALALAKEKKTKKERKELRQDRGLFGRFSRKSRPKGPVPPNNPPADNE